MYTFPVDQKRLKLYNTPDQKTQNQERFQHKINKKSVNQKKEGINGKERKKGVP